MPSRESDLLPGESLTEALAPGASVFWRKTQRGGYGFTVRIPAKVVKSHPSGRVTIDTGEKRVTVQRWSLST